MINTNPNLPTARKAVGKLPAPKRRRRRSQERRGGERAPKAGQVLLPPRRGSRRGGGRLRRPACPGQPGQRDGTDPRSSGRSWGGEEGRTGWAGRAGRCGRIGGGGLPVAQRRAKGAPLSGRELGWVVVGWAGLAAQCSPSDDTGQTPRERAKQARRAGQRMWRRPSRRRPSPPNK